MIKVTFTLVDESGGSCYGVIYNGIFTKEQLSKGEHMKLIEGKEVPEGAHFDWYFTDIE